MDINKIDKMEHLDEDSNKVCDDLEDSYNDDVEDEKEENSSEESYTLHSEIGSSSLTAVNVCKRKAGNKLTSFQQKKVEIKDIVKENVLPRLPAKSLARFRCVSMEWDQKIKSPLLALHQCHFFRDLSGYFCQYDGWQNTFLTLNNDAYGVPSPSLTFLPHFFNLRSSSNGLLLCQGRDDNNSYYICNPATREWKQLPDPSYYHGKEPAIILAFEPSLLNMNADYQLICAVPLHGEQIVCFELYSSETKSWSSSNTICVELGGVEFTGNGFYMKGLAYWETTRKEVLAFDLKNENYEIISLPPKSPRGGVLTQMRDELCYIGISSDTKNEYSIMIYGGMDLALKQKIDLQLEQAPYGIGRYRVLPCVDDGIVMFLVGSFIYSYSLSDQRAELISKEGISSLGATYLPYVNSLVYVA
ncbi:hypothetical protein ACJIZ3_002106 [Penstemon smallii]|uniref:F-box associated beta-propeller type 1 domain-containing protein n=1 Tax=Penstemon smallii TaxID=265156 RepID=A0ABD3U824_9LAMI